MTKCFLLYRDVARGYSLARYVYDDGTERYRAGCRDFNRTEALAYWGGPAYPDRERGAAYCAAVESPGFLMWEAKVAPTAYVSPLAVMDTSSVVKHGAYIGDHARIGFRAIVGNNARILGRVNVRDGASIGAYAILGSGVSVGAVSFIGIGANVRAESRIGARAFIGDGADIGSGSTVGAGAIVEFRRKISSGTNVPPGEVIR